MKVLDDRGIVVAESPVREPGLEEVLRPDRQLPQQDLAALAPASIELEAVRLYAETGSLASVSRQLGIAIYQLQKLQRTEWWRAELAALRRETLALTNAKLTELHGMALEQLEDRLLHGDFIAVGARLVRVKLPGKDLARVAETVFKQRQLLMGEPTDIRENRQLASLAEKLEALGKRDTAAAARIIDSEVCDVNAKETNTPHAEPLDQETNGGGSSPLPTN